MYGWGHLADGGLTGVGYIFVCVCVCVEGRRWSYEVANIAFGEIMNWRGRGGIYMSWWGGGDWGLALYWVDGGPIEGWGKTSGSILY